MSTVDTLGRKRSWVLSWPYLDAETFTFLDAADAGMLSDGPLWLTDPQRPNLLPEQLCSGGSVRRSTLGFTATDAARLTWAAGAVPANGGLPVSGGLRWTPPQAGGQLLTSDPVPVNTDQVITMTAWCTGPSPVFLRAQFFSATGALLASTRSPSQTPGAAWLQLTHTTTLPASTAPAAQVTANLITEPTPAGTTPGVVTTAWQTEYGTATGPFTTGGGAARVVVDSLTVAYPLPGSYAVTLTLLEV